MVSHSQRYSKYLILPTASLIDGLTQDVLKAIDYGVDIKTIIEIAARSWSTGLGKTTPTIIKTLEAPEEFYELAISDIVDVGIEDQLSSVPTPEIEEQLFQTVDELAFSTINFCINQYSTNPAFYSMITHAIEVEPYTWIVDDLVLVARSREVFER